MVLGRRDLSAPTSQVQEDTSLDRPERGTPWLDY